MAGARSHVEGTDCHENRLHIQGFIATIMRWQTPRAIEKDQLAPEIDCTYEGSSKKYELAEREAPRARR